MDSQLLGHSTPPSQSNQTPSSPSHSTQPEQHSNPNPLLSQSLSHPPPLGESVSILVHQRASQSPDPPMIERFVQFLNPPSQRNLTLPSQMNQQNHGSSQSPDHSLPPASPSFRIPLYWGNEFIMVIEPAPHGPLPHEFHRMDHLSYCVLQYFFAGGLSYTSTWSQHPNLSTSIHIQCFLNQVAFSLFLLGNVVLPRIRPARPALAFVLDRLSFFLITISGYLANMPMCPPYFAIIMFLVVPIVYIVARFRGNT